MCVINCLCVINSSVTDSILDETSLGPGGGDRPMNIHMTKLLSCSLHVRRISGGNIRKVSAWTSSSSIVYSFISTVCQNAN